MILTRHSVPERAVGDGGTDRLVGRVEATVEADLQERAGLVDDGQVASTVGRSSEIGFSQNVASPASAASVISSAWVSVLVQMATASTSVRASSSVGRDSKPWVAANRPATSGTAS